MFVLNTVIVSPLRSMYATLNTKGMVMNACCLGIYPCLDIDLGADLSVLGTLVMYVMTVFTTLEGCMSPTIRYLLSLLTVRLASDLYPLPPPEVRVTLLSE